MRRRCTLDDGETEAKPCVSRPRASSRRTNGSSARARSSGGLPGPLSSTAIVARSGVGSSPDVDALPVMKRILDKIGDRTLNATRRTIARNDRGRDFSLAARWTAIGKGRAHHSEVGRARRFAIGFVLARQIGGAATTTISLSRRIVLNRLLRRSSSSDRMARRWRRASGVGNDGRPRRAPGCGRQSRCWIRACIALNATITFTPFARAAFGHPPIDFAMADAVGGDARGSRIGQQHLAAPAIRRSGSGRPRGVSAGRCRTDRHVGRAHRLAACER